MGDYWKTRTPTKRGTCLPPLEKLNRDGEASTAARRREDRIWERQSLAKNVQLAAGMIVVFERKPWRIIEVREKPLDLWPERFEKGFADAVAHWEDADPKRRDHPKWGWPRPERATWRYRPFNVIIVPATKPTAKPRHIGTAACTAWEVLPEHYAVCVACGELPPCSHELSEKQIDRELILAQEIMSVKPGCCLGCTEPITSRMKAVRFPGPNLWRPDLGDGSAVFHARSDCSEFVDRYREQWQAKGHAEHQPTLPEVAE